MFGSGSAITGENRILLLPSDDNESNNGVGLLLWYVIAVDNSRTVEENSEAMNRKDEHVKRISVVSSIRNGREMKVARLIVGFPV